MREAIARVPGRRSYGLSVVLVLVMGLLWMATAATSAPNPPGNNGTVKIDGVAFDDHPDNEPHVGCTFQVDFYGYDEGDLDADVTFAVQPPTGPFETVLTDVVFIGEDDNSGGGSEAGLDASVTYTLDLSAYEPHPQQGWHVKLTVNADGSQGADVKHKVFWVEPCAAPPPTTVTTTVTTVAPTTVTTVAPTTVTTVAPTTVTTAAPVVAGAVAEKAPAVSAAPAVTALPRTGAGTVGLAVAGVAMTLSGLVLRGRPTRRPRRS